MTPCIRRTTVTALIICIALPAWGQQYLLYAPQPVASGQKAPSQEGVLVQEIEIQKGDTLYGLSRKFSGRGMYYPQILLFNSIKNPNLIYPGNALKIPVAQNEAHGSDRTATNPTGSFHKPKAAGDKKSSFKTETQPSARQSTGATPVSSLSTELSLSDLKAVGPVKNRASHSKRKTTVHAKKNAPQKSSAKTSSPLPAAHKGAAAADLTANAATGQKLFEAAVKAYRRDDCNAALELLDRYLVENSSSPLAADATLYKADCYLKLSAQ